MPTPEFLLLRSQIGTRSVLRPGRAYLGSIARWQPTFGTAATSVSVIDDR